ncbi:MAG: phosphodiester glycosidase family protein [Acidobacteriota bacterium]|nr:phosphodiester glycosidase family protein [Acidobacteriota bacterium]
MTAFAFAALLAIQSWKSLQPGVDFTTVALNPQGTLYVVRVDPQLATLDVGLASEKGSPRTAAAWSRDAGMSVVINAGMFQSDQRSNVGYLRHGSHANNPRFNSYRSVLAANPGTLWVDLDQGKPDLSKYKLVVQNLRLIATNRKNVWATSGRRWSEAALAEDSHGRLLFLFSRSPYSMHDFNEVLLKLPLDIRRAMHLEGGPEASLSIHAAGVDLDLCGSYETAFSENDGNVRQWPIPNVLGILSHRSR